MSPFAQNSMYNRPMRSRESINRSFFCHSALIANRPQQRPLVLLPPIAHQRLRCQIYLNAYLLRHQSIAHGLSITSAITSGLPLSGNKFICFD